MTVTAKVSLHTKTETADGNVKLRFVADYSDGRNQEWAKWTPALDLDMSVRAEVAAANFPVVGQAFTLTFEPEATDAQAQ